MDDSTHLLPRTARRPQSAQKVEDATRLAEDAHTVVRLPAHPSATGPVTGTVIKGRFVLEERIGRGGMGTVYRARDLRKEEARDTSPLVAIKFLNDDLRHQPDALIALQREAKKAQQLAHPNIVTVYDFDRDGDLVFLSMEFLDGEPLDRLIARRASLGLPPEQAMPLIERVARGLAYAHQEGFAHADLKPGNVFVTVTGSVKVLDFGIAQAVRLQHDSPHDPGDHFNPYSLGAFTPSYASPEMLRDEQPVPADDVYALACLAYELLSGRHPFRDKSGRKLPASEAQERGLRPAAIPGVSRRHMQAIRRGLAFSRAQRFQNAGEFIDAIKPRTRVRRALLWLIGGLAITAAAAWWLLVSRSDAAIDLDDLPASMATAVESVRLGDQVLERGDIDQAQNLYAHAWESGQSARENQPKDIYKLKVIIDRRINQVTDALLTEAERPDLDEFRLLQLQIALEFLREDNLGHRDAEITQALARIAAQLAAIPAASE